MNTISQREVTEKEFFAKIGPLNVHPCIEGPYPYTSSFQSPDRREYGRIVRVIDRGRECDKYYLPSGI